MIATKVIDEIERLAFDELSLKDIPFLIRSVKVWRKIAKDWRHTLECGLVCTCALLDQDFNERMK